MVPLTGAFIFGHPMIFTIMFIRVINTIIYRIASLLLENHHNFLFFKYICSLEREEATDLIKRYAGRVTGSISKKTVCILVGYLFVELLMLYSFSG